jgi:hypothetical protein
VFHGEDRLDPAHLTEHPVTWKTRGRVLVVATDAERREIELDADGAIRSVGPYR